MYGNTDLSSYNLLHLQNSYTQIHHIPLFIMIEDLFWKYFWVQLQNNSTNKPSAISVQYRNIIHELLFYRLLNNTINKTTRWMYIGNFGI